MKKPFHTLIALLFCAQFHLVAQSQQEFRLDSVYYYNWDTTLADWAFQNKYLMRYIDAGNVIETQNAAWNPVTNSWLNTGKGTYTGFDAYGNVHETLFCQWTNNNWTPNGRIVNVFSDNGKLLGGIHYSWDMGTNDWMQYARDTTFYDGNWNQTEFISYSWQALSNSWQEGSRATFIHDENGHETEQINYQWIDSNWQPTYKEIFNFDMDGNQTEISQFSWDMASGQWHQENKTTYTYDENGNQIENINWLWDSNANTFIFYRKYITTYNDLNEEVDGSTYFWNADTQTWILKNQTQITYDANNNQFENISSDLGPDNDFVLTGKLHLYWSSHTITSNDDVHVLPCSIYPNPAKNALQVQGLDRPTHASIYSVHGTLLQTAVLSDASSHLNIRQLPAGTYFLHLEAEGKTAVQRFIKQ